ncbi:MAG: hypothetical protein HRT89_15020 [Lentisphaeria bacterium]|nr:hypothetical protein [Lentisphaeria bacterium]NQZ69372.1 hypothetical protein [Lentisphaeria bacterium]
MKEYLKITLLCIFAAILYGIVHDQISAQISMEFFTKGDSESSARFIALVKGILWTWWFGLILSIPLGLCARHGKRNKLKAKKLILPVARVIATVFVFSLCSGLIGYAIATLGLHELSDKLVSSIPEESRNGYIANIWSSFGAYVGAVVGAYRACLNTHKKRYGKK